MRPSSPRTFPALMGAFGVAMGFAAFVLVREETQSKHASPVTFMLGLLAASITSYVIEAVRERAEGHSHGAAADPGRVLGLLVLLAVFEVYVSGAEQVVKLLAGGEAEKFVSTLFVSGIATGVDVIAQLLIFAGLWAVLGAAAAWSMLQDADIDLAEQVDGGAARSATVRAIAMPLWRVVRGLLLVAAIACAYVIVARLALTIWVLLTRPEDYAPAFNSLLPETGAASGNPLGPAAVLIASALEQLAHMGRWGGVALLLVVAAIAVLLIRALRASRSGILTTLMVLTLALLALGPFATNPTQFGRLLHIVSATTLTWLAPLVVLSVATPVLRAPSRFPRVWGIVAFAVAVMLVLVTWGERSKPPVPMFVASLVIALVVTAWLFWRGADVVKFWPLVALTLAVSAFEDSSLLQRLSFLTTFKEAALLQTSPLEGGQEATVARGYGAVTAWAADSSIARATATLVEQAHALPDGADTTTIDALSATIERSLDGAYVASMDSLCQPTESAVLDTLHRAITDVCRSAPRYGAVSSDSVRQIWRAMRDMSEPFAENFDSLVARSDADVRDLAYAFRWQQPTSPFAMQTTALAVTRLPAALAALDDGALMSRVMSGDTMPPTQRVLGVLLAFARTASPGVSLEGWMSDATRREFVESRSADGIMLPAVLSWWSLRAWHLRNLFEARYLGGVPVSAPVSAPVRTPARRDQGMRRSLTRVDRYDREVRTIAALHFAHAQLATRRAELQRSASLDADAGAAVLLELALGASFAFWATAGLLAGLSRSTTAA